MDAERQNKSLADRWGEFLVGVDEAVGFLFHVLDVEHVVQVAVFVADQVEHHMVVGLVGVDVVENHQCVGIETGAHLLSCVSVDDVKQCLGQRWKERSSCQSAFCLWTCFMIFHKKKKSPKYKGPRIELRNPTCEYCWCCVSLSLFIDISNVKVYNVFAHVITHVAMKNENLQCHPCRI